MYHARTKHIDVSFHKIMELMAYMLRKVQVSFGLVECCSVIDVTRPPTQALSSGPTRLNICKVEIVVHDSYFMSRTKLEWSVRVTLRSGLGMREQNLRGMRNIVS